MNMSTMLSAPMASRFWTSCSPCCTGSDDRPGSRGGSERSASELARFLDPPPIHLDEFLYSRRIGRALVLPHPGKAWEANGEAAALSDDVPSGRVHRAQGDLGADDLEDQCRLKPYVGDDAGVYVHGPLRALVSAEHFWQIAEELVGEAGSELAYGLEVVVLVIVGGHEQRAGAPAPAAPAVEGAHHHQVHRVGHLAAVLALEFDPLPPAGAGLVDAAPSFADQSLAAVLHSLLENAFQFVNRCDLSEGRHPEPRMRFDDACEGFAALLIWFFGEILAVDVDGIEDEQRGGDLLHRFLDAVFAAAGHEVLERTQVPGFGIDRDHLTLDDGVGGLQVAAGQIRDGWILGRDPFQPAGGNLNVISFLMNLQAFAVILVLGDTPAAEFGENLPGIP